MATKKNNYHGGHAAYEYVVAFAHAFLHRLVEVFGEQRGAAVEECGQRRYEGADEANCNKSLHAGRQYVLHHHGEGPVSVVSVGYVHDDAAACFL